MEERKKFKELTIGYSGVFQKTQSPEIFAKALSGIPGVKGVFIGNYGTYGPLKKYRKKPFLKFQGHLPHPEYLRFMSI